MHLQQQQQIIRERKQDIWGCRENEQDMYRGESVLLGAQTRGGRYWTAD